MIDDGKVISKSIKINSTIKFAVIIPDYFVATKKSRKILPESLSYADAVFNMSRAVSFALNMAEGKLENLREAARDRMHQPYRKQTVESFDSIFAASYEFGSRATYLSGSGPSIVCVIDENYNAFENMMNKYFRENKIAAACRVLSIDNVGAVVKY
jgi:homoserine kinase